MAGTNTMVTTEFVELTKIGLNEVFLNELSAPGQLYDKIFKVEDSNKSIEEYLQMGGFGLVPEWDANGDKIYYDKPLIGSRILFTHKDYALGWKVSHKMLREDLYKKTSAELTQSAALSVRHSIEMDAANLFNTGFTTSQYPQFGARAFFSATHPLLNGSTQSNLLTAAALTEESLQVAINAIRRAKNHRGQPMVYDIDLLLIPPELEIVATKILGSANSALLANDNGGDGAGVVASIAGSSGVYKNVLSGMIPQTMVWNYLTNTTGWFIGAKPAQRKTIFLWRERPWYDADKDFDTKGVANSVAYAYSCGAVTADGWWGNAGA
jgi:phage major head subunit gpT-like protein